MSKKRVSQKTTLVSSKNASEKPHFFSPEAKAERLKKRLELIGMHIHALQENDRILGDSISALRPKKLEAAEKLFKRLSLKELELLLDIFVNCEETGQKVMEKELGITTGMAV